MTVLLIDDDCECQDLVQETLREDGLTVIVTSDSLSGLDAAISEKPSLILADLHIHEIDIVSFVKKVRQRTALSETPIILLIPQEETYDETLFQPSDIQDTLNKPIDPTALSQKVLQNIQPTVKEEPIKEEPIPVEIVPLEKAISNTSSPLLEETISQELIASIAERVIEKKILDVIEKIAWEVVPDVLEMALPKESLKGMIERIIWETVPAIAEIEIKKEIKRLQPEEGAS